MGNIDIFANISNITITLLSLLVLTVTLLIVRQGKLPIKTGLTCIYLGLVFELISVYAEHQINIEYMHGRSIELLTFIALCLIFASMMSFVVGALQILINKFNIPIITVGLVVITILGVASSGYFVFIYPDSNIISNMKQIFSIAGFAIVSIALWAQLHNRHAIGYLGAIIAFTVVTVIAILRMFFDASSWELINNWYLSPLVYNVLAVSFASINADFLAQRLDSYRQDIVKYNRRIEEIIKSSPFPILNCRLSDDKIKANHLIYAHIYEDPQAKSLFLEDWILPEEIQAGSLERSIFQELYSLNPTMKLSKSDPTTYDNSSTLASNLLKNKQRPLYVIK